MKGLLTQWLGLGEEYAALRGRSLNDLIFEALLGTFACLVLAIDVIVLGIALAPQPFSTEETSHVAR